MNLFTTGNIPLSIDTRMKWFVNNQRFADVTFVVGEEKKIIYAHKCIIASGSPIFEQLFFSDSDQEMNGAKPIQVPDLTAVGFINMLKYIYTNSFRGMYLSEIFETFVAGVRYNVHNMNNSMYQFIENGLNVSTCCIIYDQVRKFPRHNPYVLALIDQVREMIRYNSELAFKKEYFVNISRETLVDLLRMDALVIEEIDVLKAVAEWVAEELKRLNLEPNAANKQEIFKHLKNFIRFSEIALDQLRDFGQIQDLLSREEASSLLLHHSNASKFIIGCSTARKKLTLRSASFDNELITYSCDYTQTQRIFKEFSPVSKTSGDIFITKIYSLFPINVQILGISINYSESELKVPVYCKKICGEDYCWHFELTPAVKIDTRKEFNFAFKFQNTPISHKPSPWENHLSSLFSSLLSASYCMKKIDFYELS